MCGGSQGLCTQMMLGGCWAGCTGRGGVPKGPGIGEQGCGGSASRDRYLFVSSNLALGRASSSPPHPATCTQLGLVFPTHHPFVSPSTCITVGMQTPSPGAPSPSEPP